jgi:hypothetical protein
MSSDERFDLAERFAPSDLEPFALVLSARHAGQLARSRPADRAVAK